jgi:deoxyribodipyrimidine photo-lyase
MWCSITLLSSAAHNSAHHMRAPCASSSNRASRWATRSGTDAAPYFRVFNPTGQGERFDPDGDFIRRWVPELADLNATVIHQPGVRRPDAYPAPIVDHAAERADALARYQAVTRAAG